MNIKKKYIYKQTSFILTPKQLSATQTAKMIPPAGPNIFLPKSIETVFVCITTSGRSAAKYATLDNK
jgi:hypothetical protein